MDFTPLIAQFTHLFSWLIPMLIILAVFKSRWMKGQIGELLVRLFAHWQLDRQCYRRLHNVTLDTPDGTTQIDHVFVSSFGIFVLETKNMSGWIFGGEHQAQWTQKIYRNTYRFQNPLRQNYKHLKAIEATLGVNSDHLHSVITFVGGSSFKTAMPPHVTQGIGFVRYIKSFKSRVFDESEVEALMLALQQGRRAPTFATHREHVANLKRRSDPDADRQCPKCGSALVIRTAKRGGDAGRRFWGCSTYPKCHVMQDI